jgi:hypothetical protein
MHPGREIRNPTKNISVHALYVEAYTSHMHLSIFPFVFPYAINLRLLDMHLVNITNSCRRTLPNTTK